MTRIAVLADVHGNLPALEAVVQDIAQRAPDAVIVNGDVINRGPQSKECLDAIRVAGWPVVFGNHEEYVINFAAGKLPDRWESDWWIPTRRVVEEMSADDLAYLQALPWHHVVDVPGLPAIRIVHGSLRALNDGLGFWMSDAELLEAVQDAPEPIVIGAHTHRPFDRHVDGHWVLNTGAVGAPFNGNPAAQYLLLDGDNGVWRADFRAVPYDRTPVYEAWERTGYMEISMVAQVFKYEVETATFHLIAYSDFCEANGLDSNAMSSFERYRRETQHTVPGRSLTMKDDH